MLSGRLQRGGYTTPSPFGSVEDLNAYLQSNAEGTLTTPGQKRGICLADSILAQFLYADCVRDVVWMTYAIDPKHIDTGDIETTPRVPTFDDVMKFALNRESVRINALRRSVRAPTELDVALRRAPTDPSSEDATVAIGEECSLLVVNYARGAAEPIRTERASYATLEQVEVRPLLQKLVADLNSKVGRPLLIASTTPTPPDGYSCVAVSLAQDVYTSARTLIGSHATSLVRIRDRWYYTDNEIGVAVPIRIDGAPVTYDAIQSGRFVVDIRGDGTNTTYTISIVRHGRKAHAATVTVERRGTNQSVEELNQRDRVYLFAACPSSESTAAAAAPSSVMQGTWYRANWNDMDKAQHDALDAFWSSDECFRGRSSHFNKTKTNPEIWICLSEEGILFAASVEEDTSSSSRHISQICTAPPARRQRLLAQMLSHVVAAYRDTRRFTVFAELNGDERTLQTQISIYERYGFWIQNKATVTLATGETVTIVSRERAPDGRSWVYNGSIPSDTIRSCSGTGGGCVMLATPQDIQNAIPDWETLVAEAPIHRMGGRRRKTGRRRGGRAKKRRTYRVRYRHE